MTTKFGNVRSAALYVNNTLVSKGFIKDSERLEFASLNGDLENEEEEGEDREDIEGEEGSRQRVNDIHTINAIYSLLNTIDSDSRMNEESVEKVSELRREYDTQKQRHDKLVSQSAQMEQQLRQVNKSHHQVEQTLGKTERSLGLYKEENSKLKTMSKQMKQQFATELRKRDVQIAKLKERLTDGRTRTKTVYGVSGTLSKSYSSHSPAVIVKDEGAEEKEEVAVRRALNEEISTMNKALVNENNTLHDLLMQIRESVSGMEDSSLVSYSSNEEDLTTAGVITKTMNAQELAAGISTSVKKITDALNSPNFVSVGELEAKQLQIDRLKQQLREVTDNWKSAVNTMEEWKSTATSARTRLKVELGEGVGRLVSEGAKSTGSPTRKSSSTTPRKSLDPKSSVSSLRNATAASTAKS